MWSVLLASCFSTAVTFQDISEIAGARAPDVLVAQATASVSSSEVPVAAMLQNPQLTTGTNYNAAHIYNDLLFAFPTFGQRSVAIEAAQAKQATAQQGIFKVRNDARLQARLTWLDLWQAEREQATQTETLARRERILEMIRARREAGQASDLEIIRTDAEVARADADLQTTSARVEQMAAQLCLWLADSACERVLHAEGDPPQHVTPAEDVRTALSEHPTALYARAARHAASAQVRLEKRLRWPMVGLEVGYQALDRGFPSTDAHVALSFELPLFHVHGPLVERARALERQAESVANAWDRRLLSAATAAYHQWRAADARVGILTDKILPAASTAAQLANEGYQVGAFDINSVLLAEQSLADARLEQARANADRGRAWAQFHYAVGDER